MQRRLKHLPFLGLFLGVLAACDSAPTAAGIDDVAAIIAANPARTADMKSARGTLPALFREAVAKIEAEQGRSGVASQLDNWKRLQDELIASAAVERAAVQARLDAIHNEELRIVIATLGTQAIARSISETAIGLAQSEHEIALAETAGHDLTRARTVTQQVRAELSAARHALVGGESTVALDRASEAATMVAGLQYFLTELRRIPGLETLYPRAVEQLKAQPGAGDAFIARVDRLNQEATGALRAGNRGEAHKKLQEVRTEQARVVLTVLGAASARDLVREVGNRTELVRATLLALKNTGSDVARYERMLRQVVDLKVRADSALLKGDGASALDLGSHAAGILNTLQHLTWK